MRSAALSFALLLSACGESPELGEARNLLVLVADTLRADALGCYGGDADTPNICSLAERGTLFERVYSGGPWTLPSSVALFTGNHPPVYAHDGSTGALAASYTVPDAEVLLAEALRDRGFRTAAFVENGIAVQPNVFQGFVLERLDQEGGTRAGAAKIAEIAEISGYEARDSRYVKMLPLLQFLARDDASPFYALHWIMDPHAVYFPPKIFLNALTVDPRKLPKPLRYYASLGNRDLPERGEIALEPLADDLLDVEVRALVDLYHRELESVDERVGYALRVLEARGTLADTVVVFTSDHGEGFGEHGKFLHAPRWLYDEFIRVPMLIAGPGVKAGLRVEEAVSLVDLMPTLWEWFGVESEGETDGVSFASLLRGEQTGVERSQYVSDVSRHHGYSALIEGNLKLIERPDEVELYALDVDPRERNDLSLERPDEVRDLAEKLVALRARDEARRRANLERIDAAVRHRTAEETERQLRSLGYLE